MTLDPANASEISPHDPVVKVLGKEHLGRVRSLSMGAIPTSAFRHSTRHLDGMHLFSMGEFSRAAPELVNTVQYL